MNVISVVRCFHERTDEPALRNDRDYIILHHTLQLLIKDQPCEYMNVQYHGEWQRHVTTVVFAKKGLLATFSYVNFLQNV